MNRRDALRFLPLLPLACRAAENAASLPDASAVHAVLRAAIAGRVIPGAVYRLGHGSADLHAALGLRAVKPATELMTEDTIFDVASLTKVIATAPSIMLLMEQGRLRLDAPVRDYLAEFHGDGRERITLRHLLTHTSGLKPSLSTREPWSGADTGIHMACATVPEHAPDGRFRYSDINFILLGEIVRRVGGQPLDVFAKTHIFAPLQMRDTGFLPAAALRARIAPTEKDESGVLLRGVVHDPTSRRMGGVAGHAGLFSTAADLARYCRMIIGGGELEGVRLLKPETVKQMTAVQTPDGKPDKRGLGWDIDTRFSKPRGGFPVGESFGHTGFTGACVWLHPGSASFYVFLSSRLHETDPKSDSRAVYEQMGNAVSALVLAEKIAEPGK